MLGVWSRRGRWALWGVVELAVLEGQCSLSSELHDVCRRGVGLVLDRCELFYSVEVPVVRVCS